MTLRATGWAFSLRDIGPLAKLVAIFVSERCADDGRLASPVQIRDVLDFCGCTRDELDVALLDLKACGVEAQLSAAGATFVLPIPPRTVRDVPKPDEMIFIYVIRSYAATKVGISRMPEARLAGLQAANPMEQLTIEYTARGPASVIRAIEKQVHGRLDSEKIGNEWFEVEPEMAIALVKQAIHDAGLAS